MTLVLDFCFSRYMTLATNMVEEEIFKLLGVNKEIKALKESLGTINDYLLLLEQKRRRNSDIYNCVQKLKDVKYDADDVIDFCMIEGGKLLKPRVLSSSSTVSIPFSYFFSCFQCLKYRHDIANKIIALNNKLEGLKQDPVIRNNLDKANKESVEDNNRGITYETSHLVEGDVIGTQIENAIETLIDWIFENNPEKCRVFGVVGTGGIGKSTLASKIFEDERIKKKFPKRNWLYVSKNCICSDLLKQLIRSEDGSEKGENLEGKSKTELEKIFVYACTQDTFIVLDDVWDSNVWIKFLRNPIMNSEISCTVLVTSRKENVVNQMKPTRTHSVEKMDKESGWNLLKHLVFGRNGDEDEISSFEEIGIKLVDKCDGLPLSIKAIAGVLVKQNKAKWEEVLASDAWNMDPIEEDLRPLYLSYEDLPFEFTQCFLHCSLYPQKNMYSKEIVQIWAAEGLIKRKQDMPRRDFPNENQKTMEDVGEDIYRELICRNLLDANIFDASKSFFSMHDHFRSLSANLMREEGILYRHDPNRDLKVDDNVKIRRLSISCMGSRLVLPDQILRQACLRTLILMDSPKTMTIEDRVLQALPYLRVLHLTKTSIEKIPDCIGDLLLLRYLGLGGTNIREIPMTIGNLVYLQSLNISDCEFLERLPVSITKLHNLRWLNMINCPMLTHLPKGIGKLENFYSLHGFMIGQSKYTSEEGCDLKELKNLSELRILSIFRLERAERGDSALAKMPFLKELTLAWMQPDEEEDDNGGGYDTQDDEEADDDGKDNEDANNDMGDGDDDDGSGQWNECEEAEEDENEEMEGEEEEKGWSEEQISKAERICNEMSQPSSTILDLLFQYYPGRQFPSWMKSSSLAESFPNLTYLKLVGLPCCTELPPLGTLPELKYLNIESASAVTTIGSQFLGSRKSAFPKLEVLQFKGMSTWTEWTFNGTPPAVNLFPSLSDCVIMDCPKLRALPDGLHQATKLNQLCLRQTYELGEINNLTLAYKLEVTNGRGLKKISNIQSLRYLAVDNCPNLEGVEDLGKLQHLVLMCSKKTKQLPRWLPGLIEQHNNTASNHMSLKKFEMQCNLQLLKSCFQGNENWDIIKQIPAVKIQTYSGREYIRYTKDPYIYDPHVPSD